MFLGALVDAGVRPELLQQTVAALDIGARLEFSRVVRSGISAAKADVWVDGKKDVPRDEHAEEHHAHEHQSSKHHEHQHEHTHTHHGESARAGAPAPHVWERRSLPA